MKTFDPPEICNVLYCYVTQCWEVLIHSQCCELKLLRHLQRFHLLCHQILVTLLRVLRHLLRVLCGMSRTAAVEVDSAVLNRADGKNLNTAIQQNPADLRRGVKAIHVEGVGPLLPSFR